MGVWIEIYKTKIGRMDADVAPLVGVWIEITLTGIDDQTLYSRSPRGSVD